MSSERPGPVGVQLRPMTDDEFAAWSEGSVESYAADVARATGRPVEKVRERARAQYAELLPDGRESPSTWLMTICDDSGAAVGILWLARHPDHATRAYIYEIEIDESRRGEGLGRAAMIAAEELAKDNGLDEIGLNVFGFNDVALSLYRSLDYQVVSTQMTKRLG